MREKFIGNSPENNNKSVDKIPSERQEIQKCTKNGLEELNDCISTTIKSGDSISKIVNNYSTQKGEKYFPIITEELKQKIISIGDTYIISNNILIITSKKNGREYLRVNLEKSDNEENEQENNQESTKKNNNLNYRGVNPNNNNNNNNKDNLKEIKEPITGYNKIANISDIPNILTQNNSNGFEILDTAKRKHNTFISKDGKYISIFDGKEFNYNTNIIIKPKNITLGDDHFELLQKKKENKDKIYESAIRNMYENYIDDTISKITNPNTVINKALVLAFLKQESHFNPNVNSRRGCKGLGQIAGITFTEILKGKQKKGLDNSILLSKSNTFTDEKLNLFDPEISIKGVINYLVYLEDRFRNEKPETRLNSIIQSYNIGYNHIKNGRKATTYLNSIKKYYNQYSTNK